MPLQQGFKHGWLQLGIDTTDSLNGVDILSTEGKPSRFQKIHAGSQFNKQFVPTYNVVVAAIVLLFTVLHGLRKLNRTRRARRARRNESLYRPVDNEQGEVVEETSRTSSTSTLATLSHSESTSSSTETLADIATDQRPKADLGDENAALLEKHTTLPSRPTMSSRLAALLIYQPRSIPVINKELPDNTTSLLVLCLLGLNVFYTFFNCPLQFDIAVFVFSDRTGLLFIANLPLLYFLGAKNQPLKLLTDCSYETLNIYHRRLGEVLCLLSLLHTAGMFAVWYTVLRPTGWTLLFFLTRSIIILGTLAFLAYSLLYLTSLRSFRRRWYELFLVLHIILQAAALPLLWFHHRRSKPYVLVSLAIFTLDRLIFRLILKSASVPATLDVLKDNATVLLTAAWRLPARSKPWYARALASLTNSYKAGWAPAQHVFLTIPALSSRHTFQAHPFSVASVAPASADIHATLRLLIRAHDGFTRDLVEYAKYKSGIETVRLDGPYGGSRALELLLDADLAVVVAGGSGIAVGAPLVAGLVARRAESRIGEDEECGDVKDSAGKAKLGTGRNGQERTRSRICLIWVVHSEAQTEWLPREDADALRAAGVDIVVPRPTVIAGRPDVSRIVETWIAERVVGDHDGEHGGAQTGKDGVTRRRQRQRVGVVCSGPESMNRGVRHHCAKMAWKSLDVGVEVEKYGW